MCTKPLRIEYVGSFYHVMARGNKRNDTFKNDRDREIYAGTIKDMS